MPKIVDHDERRQTIAAAVLRVIAQHGVRGADIRSVAREAGWSTGVIAHYYDDKQAMLIGALREAVHHVALVMADITHTSDGMAQLHAMLEAGMPLDDERAATCRIFYHFAAEGMNDAALSVELGGYYLWWRKEVADTIELAQAQGHFTGQNVMALAETLVALAEGLAIQAMFGGQAIDRVTLRARINEAIISFDLACGAATGVGR
ncbi:MAG: TetR/AcrR family transcriptional regulator [Pseudomonadota bacterium]